MGCKRNCIQDFLESIFYKHGKLVARYPLPFLIIPVIIFIGLSLGMIRFNKNDNIEDLYTPTNGRAKDERLIIQALYPENDTYYFNANRKTGLDGFVQIVITDPQEENVFTSSHMQKIIELDQAIKSLSSEKNMTYKDVCALWKGSCTENMILDILNFSADSINVIPVSYPLHNTYYFLGYQLGGVVNTSLGIVTSAKAVFISYSVRYISNVDIDNSNKWITAVKNYLLNYKDSTVTVNFQTSLSLEEELATATEGIVPRFSITYTVLCTFCSVSCLMLDWVRTKSLFAIGGEVAAGMAVVSSLGLLLACGMEFTSTVGSMPFIIVGIGIDDMFIILSSWRHTSYMLPYEERMGQTFKTAAISITLTSITDTLAFGIGAITTFRAVTLFCAYAGVAVVFSYIYAITFLAACLAISGRREEANRHELTCMKVLPKSQADHRSKAYKIFCTGGCDREEEQKKTETSDMPLHLPWITEQLSETFAPFIMKIPMKVIILVFYCIYIGFSIWGCFQLMEGLELKNLAPDNSYVVPFYEKESQYFRSEYGPRVMVSINEPLNYSMDTTRQSVMSQLDQFYKRPVYYTDQSLSESWLSSFSFFLANNASNANPTSMLSFIQILQNEFLVQPQFENFKNDVTFNSDFSQITASRFLLQSLGVADANEERTLMTDSRDIADASSYNMTIYHPAFIYYDQYLVITKNTMQNLGIAVASMLLVSLLLLPSIVSVLWVTLSVVSICTGVVGFMSFWNVNLDSISMINLIMCIGFSVDFSAHISYHFTISNKVSGNDKAIDAMGHLGTPIVQGAISTILGVIVLATSPSYIFRTFFKILFLVMIFGFLHAMFVLPVVLSIFNCKRLNRV